jgi:NAD(P)-dependent dehydrogenase (short-subunit alcohol dehydrogenase family)
MSTVLITGAARGLGFDFVKQYAAKGCGSWLAPVSPRRRH